MPSFEQDLTKRQLKNEVQLIVLAQGNEFIKELLRANGLKIGSTKPEFALNLTNAIDSGGLTQPMIEAWLQEVEGWGNQHLYLFEAPGFDRESLNSAILESEYAGLLNVGMSHVYSDAIELGAISLDDQCLSLVWQQGKEGWNRHKTKDHQERDGLEIYKYEAYRRRVDRSLIRFEWRFADDSCTILIHRNKDIDHKEVQQQVWAILAEVGIVEVPPSRISLTQAVMFASREGTGVQSTRFGVEGGYVEMASTLPDTGIDDVEAVRQARLGVNDSAFSRAEGMIHFHRDKHDLSRSISVQIYGSEGRLRIWAQCRREDVYFVLDTLAQQNIALNDAA